MTKVKEYLIGQDTFTTKPVVVAQHIEQWHNKALHGQWPKLLLDRNINSPAWLRTAHRKPVTETLIAAAQDQALNTKWLGDHILGTVPSDCYRKCRQFAESIEHIVVGCPVMTQTVYLDCHNAMTSTTHRSL